MDFNSFFHDYDSTIADILRAIVICLCLYGSVIAFLTRRTLLKRIALEKANFIRTLPNVAVKHVKRVTLWGVAVCFSMSYDAYVHFNTGVRAQTIMYLILSAYFVRAINPMYYFELATLVRQEKVIADARAAVEKTEDPNL